MSTFLHNLVRPSRNAHSPQVRAMLGLDSKAKLPVEGMPARVVQGIKVWVEPLVGAAPKNSAGRTAKRSTHRVLAECPHCQQVLSAGRLHQHKCK